MACIAPDGSLSDQARAVLRSLEPGRTLEVAATENGLPLYRIRSSVRELVQAGLVEESGDLYRTTPRGVAKLG